MLGYDALGNIQSKSDVGTYNYNDPNHPQQITSLTPVTGPTRNFSYDPDGNLLNDGVHVNSFDALNRVTGIQDSGANATVQIAYTPDGARYQETTTVGASATTLTEVNALFEVVATSTSTAYREMILGGNGIVAIRSIQDSGILTTRYLTGDHLGSVSEISNEVGSVVERMSYDAFGQRTDPATWQPYSTVPDLTDITDKGYTGQQQLDAVGLIHMNGRVYDPQIGRFVSADPTIPDPFDSQGFNRYSYVENNPLSLTDPSGFCSQNYIIDCPPAPGTTDIVMCFSGPCGAASVPSTPGNTDTAGLGTIIVSAPIAPTNVPLPQSSAVTTSPTVTSTPGQISGGKLLSLPPLLEPDCANPDGCSESWDLQLIGNREGFQTWDGQVFGGALGDTGLQGPPKNADGAGGKGGGSPGRQPAPNQTKVPYHPAGGGRGPTVGTNPVPGSVGMPIGGATAVWPEPWISPLAEPWALNGILAALANPIAAGIILLAIPSETASNDYTQLNHYTTLANRAGIEADKFIVPGPSGNIYFTPDTYTSSSQAASALQITPPAGFYMVPLQNIEPISGYGDVLNGTGQEIIVNHPVSITGAIWVPIPP